METLKQNLSKANKKHKCDYCLQDIVIGERYYNSTHKYDGEIYTWKSHEECARLVEKLKMQEYTEYGVTTEFFIENIQEVYQNIMSEHFNKQYEDEYFTYPPFRDQLYLVSIFNKDK